MVQFFHSSIRSQFLLVLRLSVEDHLGQQLLPLLSILARYLGCCGHGDILRREWRRGGQDLSGSSLVPDAWAGAVNLDSHAGGHHQQHQGEEEQDLKPVGCCPDIPSLCVDPDLAHRAGVLLHAGPGHVGQTGTIAICIPADDQALGVITVRDIQLVSDRVSHRFSCSKPSPVTLLQTDARCQHFSDILSNLHEDSQEHVPCQDGLFLVIVDTQQLSLLLKALLVSSHPVHLSLLDVIATVYRGGFPHNPDLTAGLNLGHFSRVEETSWTFPPFILNYIVFMVVTMVTVMATMCTTMMMVAMIAMMVSIIAVIAIGPMVLSC